MILFGIGDNITNETGFHLIKVLPSFPNLFTLDIGDTFINEHCLSQLLMKLPKMKNLFCLKIGGTPLSDSFIKLFSDTIKNMKNLGSIYVDSIFIINLILFRLLIK